MQYPVSDSYKLFIGGRWVDASDGATLDTYCPANGERIASIADATHQDVDAAVDAAHEAFASWKATQKGERARILNAIADVIEENAEHLALVESIDNGKPIRETRAIDVAYSAEHFRYFAGVLLAETGEADMVAPNMMSIVVHEPIGVVGQIVPWNFPLLMAAWKLAPVLAAGDCTVLKPSSSTSLSVLELARLTQGIIPASILMWLRVAVRNRVNICLRTHESPSSLSPALPRSGARLLGPRPIVLSPRRSSWVENRPILFSPMPRGTWPSTESSWVFCSTRARSAAQEAVSSSMRTYTTNSSPKSLRPSRRSRWVCRGTRTPRWGRKSTNARRKRYSTTWNWRKKREAACSWEAVARPKGSSPRAPSSSRRCSKFRATLAA